MFQGSNVNLLNSGVSCYFKTTGSSWFGKNASFTAFTFFMLEGLIF